MGIRELIAAAQARNSSWDRVNSAPKTRRFVPNVSYQSGGDDSATTPDSIMLNKAKFENPTDTVNAEQSGDQFPAQTSTPKYGGGNMQNPVTGDNSATRPRIELTDQSKAPVTDEDAGLTPLEVRRKNLYAQKAQLEDFKNNPIKNEDSRLTDVWKGAQNGARIALGTGNIGYTLGAIGGGAIRGLFDRKADEKAKRKADIEKTKSDIADTEKQMDADIERQGKIIGNNQKALDYMRSANKPFYDSIMADDQITQEEADEAQKRGFGKLMPYDARQFDTIVDNGVTKNAPKKGVPNYLANPTIKVDKTKVPVDTSIKTGDKTVTLPLLPNQAATTIVGVEQANAQRAQQAAQFVQKQEEDRKEREYKSQKELDDDVRTWERRQLESKGKIAKANAALNSAKTRRAELLKNEDDTKDVDKIITAAEGDLAEANELLKEKKPAGTIRQKSSVKTSKGGKNNNIGTTDNYNQALKKIRGF